MSPLLARLVASSAAAGCAVFASLALAAPAHAAGEVDVRISNLSSQFTPGGRSDSFTVRFSNDDEDNEYVGIRVVFTIRLNGLSSDGVRVSRRLGGDLPKEATGSGEVRLTDPFRLRLNREDRAGDSQTHQYQIQFTSGAPGGRAELVAEAFLGDRLLGSADDNLNVRGEPAPSSEQTTEAPVTTPAQPGATGPQITLAPVDPNPVSAARDADGGVPTIFYVLGGVLVVAGAVILWMLFRGPRPALVDARGATVYPDTTGGYQDTTGGYRPARLSHPVYPPPAYPRPQAPPTAVNLPPTAVVTPTAANPAPTSVIPPIDDPYRPHHLAVDPWAGQTDDDTGGLGRR